MISFYLRAKSNFTQINNICLLCYLVLKIENKKYYFVIIFMRNQYNESEL